MALQIAEPYFRVAEFPDGTPFIFIERREGDELQLFKNGTDFRLPVGSTMEQAQAIADYLNANIDRIAENT
ncbi:hypothetical protein [Rhizobium leguminosarum]|uniref:hypothetical protein n=1 Tax=Rhizobium leguminosarum TaxID=384 RepID=UPI0010322F00|nr:hypothetical protein [Rhizobium leguminosarum]TAV89301.1 hypothetical protein ELI22_08790 [Rhizobium leguminosarum]TAV93882.1 hypothetical protein ELI21_08780 [Rhizobium leguminosarum]TAW34959.1 hypothetical protein ELI23_08820 [Rhizobium leguminosarum]